jgi:hypothetical protein
VPRRLPASRGVAVSRRRGVAVARAHGLGRQRCRTRLTLQHADFQGVFACRQGRIAHSTPRSPQSRPPPAHLKVSRVSFILLRRSVALRSRGEKKLECVAEKGRASVTQKLFSLLFHAPFLKVF